MADGLSPADHARRSLLIVNLDSDNGRACALTAAALSARLAAPQFGVGPDRYPDETRSWLQQSKASSVPGVLVIGGPAFVSEAVAAAIDADVRRW